jgi:hypothetical protein
MRRLLGWISGALGGVAAYRMLRRRKLAEPAPVWEHDTRAEELRTKLAEARAAEPAVEEPPAEPVEEPAVEEPPAEPVEEAAPVEAGPEDEAEPEPESPDDRRKRVHEEGRAALDEMTPDDPG